jgi:hypothetical protein
MKMKESFIKRLISLILAVFMICTAGPVFAECEEPVPPLADAAPDICLAAMSLNTYAQDVTYYETEIEASAEIREDMKARQSTVTVGIKGKTDQEGLQQIISRLIGEATEHTGKPDEGDYILFQYEHYDGAARQTLSGVNGLVDVRYDLFYYDDADQEAEVDKKVSEILEELDLDKKTKYEKVKAIHDYLCDNIEYRASDDGSDICRTAYGALIEGNAVCQGYSVSLYRLLLEAGIDNRIIYGTSISPFGTTGSHTWNIVDLYGKYYYIDVTWDDCSGSNDYLLVPAGKGFEDEHIADEKYSNDSFTSSYPMADEEYEENTDGLFEMLEKMIKLIMDAMVAKK